MNSTRIRKAVPGEEAALHQARDKHVSKIKLESTITAFEFYKSFGFEATGPKQMVEIGGYPVTSFPMELLL